MTAPPARGAAVGAGALGMTCVGGSVAVSGVLADAPVFTAQAVRYAVACLLLLGLARLTRRRIELPRGTEWLWLLGVTATGLVLFNIALIRGSAHAEPAVLGVAVACVPVVLAVVGPLLDGNRPRPPQWARLPWSPPGRYSCRAGDAATSPASAGRPWCCCARSGSRCSRCRCCVATGRGGLGAHLRARGRPARRPRARDRRTRCGDLAARPPPAGGGLPRGRRHGGGLRALVLRGRPARFRACRAAHRRRADRCRRSRGATRFAGSRSRRVGGNRAGRGGSPRRRWRRAGTGVNTRGGDRDEQAEGAWGPPSKSTGGNGVR